MRDRTRGYSPTVAAHRKLGPIEVEQIVAARGAGRSLREIAAALGVSHSTVSLLSALVYRLTA